MAYRIILRRDSSSNWTSNNPVLLSGEPGYETDTGKIKIGDGSSLWDNLGYLQGTTGPQGNVGPTGAGSTGPNTFYGNQTIIGGTAGTIILDGAVDLNFSSDPDAAAAGVPLYGIYHNNGELRVRII